MSVLGARTSSLESVAYLIFNQYSLYQNLTKFNRILTLLNHIIPILPNYTVFKVEK